MTEIFHLNRKFAPNTLLPFLPTVALRPYLKLFVVAACFPF